MPLKKPFIDTNFLPRDVFTYQDEQFYDFVSTCIGHKQADLLKFEEISSAQIYLTCGNVLDILKLESSDLIPFKESLCLKLNNNSFKVLPGVESSFIYLTELLSKKRNEVTNSITQKLNHRASSNIAAATNIATSDNITSSAISTASISTQSQSDIVTHNIVTTPDQHRQLINRAIEEWVLKNKNKFGDQDLKLIQGVDCDIYITVNPNKAVIRCNCGIKATLRHIRNNYQASDQI
ncbi:unnamed protein product [Rotaria magnacalcarata]|uniref:Uncharacterized protein n=1 Tax=Rotaria magnacalcarata TaxID=392030 RepID=A0A816WG61_9BILA|nr:unnamed protein product [Rotaria magnacalcarata]CAF4272176.1 unnamed protein product [Rotaria magnacalcarata]